MKIIERTPRTLKINGKTIKTEELAVPLAFTRKPVDLDHVDGTSRDVKKVCIAEVKELTPAEFDSFSRNLLVSHDWLSGKGGGTSDVFVCLEITAKGRPSLFVNPEGSDYARYVARFA